MSIDYKELAEILFPYVTMTPADVEAKYPPRTDLPEGAVISRSAPSPTGFVHLGNLVQGLTSERMCHQSGGTLYLRVEDTDAKREVPGAIESLVDYLSIYGIEFDEGVTKEGDKGVYGPYRQRQRKDIYHVFAKKLTEEGKAYPCFCTEEELADMHEKQAAEKANFGYFGKWAIWRDRSIEEIKAAMSEGKPWVLRFRSEGNINNKVKFTDLIKGNLELTENDIDHVLLKSDGIPTYHFAHAVDDRFMYTTHVVRDDSWLSTLPFHVQLFSALGWKPPKYLHIGPLMKMDGESKRKLSKRKDPELALSYYHKAGFPSESVYEYLLTVLNSNFEDWRRANQDAPATEFKFSYKKMNPAGSLFDYAKLCDVSKNVVSRMTAEQVYDKVVAWAKEFDEEFANVLVSDKDTAIRAFAIGRGGKKPRKDLTVWADAREYMGFFYDSIYELRDVIPEKFDKADIVTALDAFCASYSETDTQQEWFDKIKVIAESIGYTTDMKAYKADPDAFKGNVGDVSMFLRVAVTGKMNSPDMYEVMNILGKEKVFARINNLVRGLK